MTKLGTDTSAANSFQEEIYSTSDGTIVERGSRHPLSFISQLNGHESLRQYFCFDRVWELKYNFGQQYLPIHLPFFFASCILVNKLAESK